MLASTFLHRVRQQMFLQTLRKTQYLPKDQLRAYQNRLLGGLLTHAARNVPFYRDRLAPAFGPDGGFVPERFREIPILTRSEAQDDPDALTARETTPLAGEATSDATSGSTGQSFRHKRSAMVDVASRCHLERTYEWAGLDPSCVVANIRVDRSGTAVLPHGNRGWGWSIRYHPGVAVGLSIDVPIDKQITWLQSLKPDYLLTYSSNARAIAEACHDRGIDLGLKHLMTGSETCSKDMRELFANVFGCSHTDHYGCQELGYLAGECADSGQYHVAAESIFMELLDDDGEEVAPGEIGRVVLTSFYNYAMPFIRYAIGDYARRGDDAHSSGRTLPALAEIMGRTRNMFTFPGGRTIWPNSNQGDIKTFLPVKRMQVIQREPLEIVLRYTRDPNGVEETDFEGLQAYMRKKLDPRITLTLNEIDAFEPRPGSKFEDYLSLVSPR